MLSKVMVALLPTLYFMNTATVVAIPRIDWFPCPQNGTLPLKCGTLEVPLDYEEFTSNQSLTLQLVKIAAVKQPKKGSILFNPGGPGGSGRVFIAGDAGPGALIATGGVYDLIGFDPRGVGETIPFSCYTNDTEREVASIKLPRFLNASDTATGSAWAIGKTFARSCDHNAKNIGQLVGTGYVARDMMQIVDALQEDGLLNYWGLSYGTVLGATAAAMFPNRMGHVVLDAVLNPRNYYAGIDLEETTGSDISFDGFFTGCIANPKACALAQDAPRPDLLKEKFYRRLYSVKYEPLVAGSEVLTDVIDYQMVKQAVVSAMYSPSTWPELANGLHGLLTGNLRPFLETAALLGEVSSIPEASIGIRASDTTLRTSNLSSLYPLIKEFYAKSHILGDVLSVLLLSYAQWPFHAKGAYTGDWTDIKTKNPLLFIGSKFDPITPLVSAVNASSSFPGSAVLEHTGYGHTSLAHPSLCVARLARAYFVNGTLPAPGTKCEPSFPLFSNKTAADALAPIANFSKRALVEDDDAVLLSAMVQLRKSIPHGSF